MVRCFGIKIPNQFHKIKQRKIKRQSQDTKPILNNGWVRNGSGIIGSLYWL